MRTLQHVADICLDYVETADASAQTASATPAQRRSLISLMTAALQECYVKAPDAFQGQRGETIPAPVTANITATNASRTVDLSAFSGDQRARTLAVSGQYYQVAITPTGTSELVQPWTGTTGTHSVTIYGDAIEVGSTFHHLVGNVQLDGYRPLAAAPDLQSFKNIQNSWIVGDYGRYSGSVGQWPMPTGVPDCYFVESGYLNTSNQAASRNYIRFSPLPSTQYRVTYTVAYRPREISEADLTDTAVVLPMPGDFVDSIFVPMVLQRWTGSPWFRNESAKPEIGRQFKVAEKLLNSWSPQDHTNIQMDASGQY